MNQIDEKISFIANIEGTEIKFTADMLKKQQSSIWDCSQSPESDDPEDTKLHWSVSVNYKKYSYTKLIIIFIT